MTYRIMTFLVVLITASGLSTGQEADTAHPSGHPLEAVIVQSSRAGKLDPVTQTTIDSADLRTLVVGQDLQFVLELASPSIVAYSESGTNFSNYGSFRLRGIDQTRVNVTLNGAPLNDMVDQGVFFSNITDLANGMSSVQVQRGVGLSQNGTASYAGSINLESPRLYTEPRGKLQFTAGSFRLLRGSAEVYSGLLESNTSIYAKVTSFQTDGYRYNTGTSSLSGIVSAAWYGADDVVKFTAVGGNTKNELGYFLVPKPLVDEDPRTNLNDTTDHDDFGQYLLQLEWDHQLTGSTVLSLMSYYGSAGGDFFSGWRDENNALTQINYPLSNAHFGGIAQVSATNVVSGLDLKGGVHVYRFWRRNWEIVMPDQSMPYYDDRTVKNEASASVSASYTTGGLGLSADVQARSVSMTFSPDARYVPANTAVPTHDWFFLNPRVGASYSIAPSSSVYASIGQTGREPTRFDLLGGTQINDANIAVIMNPNTVRPEYALDIEAGYRFAGKGLSAEVNVFHMSFTDEIAPIGQFIEQQFVQLRKNVPSSTRYGVELTARANLSQVLSLYGSATWMKGNIDTYAPDGADVVYTNLTPVLTPELLANITIEARPVESIVASVMTRYIGGSFLSLPNSSDLRLDGAAIVDLRAQWNIYGVHSIGITLFNTLDQRYATNGATVEYEGNATPAIFIQAPRSFLVMYELQL